MEKFIVPLLLLATIAACQPKQNAAQKQLLTEIQALESTLLQTADASKNKDVALQLVEKSEQFAKANPADSLTPTLLFKAAEVARGSGNFGKAVQLWGEVWREYENHPKAPMALFLQGFTFDSDLRDSKMATKYYNDFLQKYPKDALAEQVKQLLAVVEQNPEDMVKEFEKNKEEE